MNELEYVKMLEVPVSSSGVEFKPFKKRKKDVKKKVIDKVNLEAVSEKPQKKSIKDTFTKFFAKKEKPEKTESSVEIQKSGFDIVSMQVVTIFVLIVGIILTNIFIENSGINRLMRSVFASDDKVIEKTYTEFDALSPSKSSTVSLDGGVMTVSKGCVYSPCDGVVESVLNSDGKYVLTVLHSDSFTSVISNLDAVYLSVGETVYSNIPVGYSGDTAYVSMFNDDAILTSYVIDEDRIVWM